MLARYESRSPWPINIFITALINLTYICLDIFSSYIRQDTPTLPLDLAFFGADPLHTHTFILPHHCSLEISFALSHSWKDKQSERSRWWGKVFSLSEQGFSGCIYIKLTPANVVIVFWGIKFNNMLLGCFQIRPPEQKIKKKTTKTLQFYCFPDRQIIIEWVDRKQKHFYVHTTSKGAMIYKVGIIQHQLIKPFKNEAPFLIKIT